MFYEGVALLAIMNAMQCAKRATEKYSGKVSAAIDITDLIGKDVAEAGALSTRNPTEEHKAMLEQVVTEITDNKITKGDVTKLKVSLHPLME